ncbi:DsbA family oxidoreductase [Lacibacter sp.]|uniref:DsbA family oxidoreductase n=1 Tax=Lacibacter sp. TaxID=1915409 RepID=UPI002B4AF54F|nr:DsbA family oxidoreductase [Lacibacter sp.]HLP39448.1 DsbA family oxidoreductase [Lacibacter sp.]
MTNNKMKVEIWSDVTCPFCYIGKRKFEHALNQFKDADKVEIIWKSFELAPGFQTEPVKDMYQFLAAHNGVSLEQIKTISNQLADSAWQVGLQYNLEKAIPANSFNAHRLSHLAKQRQLQDKAEERLFKAYFTEGKNIDDIPTLIALGKEIGLDAAEVKNVLESDQYADEVRQDIADANQAGVKSVPHFTFNGQESISGAQDSKVFLEKLELAFTAWKSKKSLADITATDGQACKIGEVCS